MKLPTQDGYYMPGELAPHSRCWMAWLTEAESFLGKLDETRNAYANVARAIARFEPVTMVVRPQDAEEAGRRCGPEISRIDFIGSSGPLGRSSVTTPGRT